VVTWIYPALKSRSSLWQVSDEATADLMQLFYQDNGKDKREALHSAQLTVKAKYPHS
jgi:CHAT domain-containing protein